MSSLSSVPIPPTNTLRFQELNIDALHQDEWLVAPVDPSEQRAKVPLWDTIRASHGRNYIDITDISNDSISMAINGKSKTAVALTDEVTLSAILRDKKILLDISGLPHHVWAPLLKAAYIGHINVRVVYSEPESYRPHDSPASDSLFDLSTEFGGLAPLPGFAQLLGPDDNQERIFIALLGFEGNRPRSLVYTLDPEPKVVPIVGVPGFQHEFPSYTVTSNKELLREFNAYHDIRYSKASCPFDTYKAINEIRTDFPDAYMYLAPVGTKPHSLGAILYAITNSTDTEILFDHPVRKTGRTKGVGMIHIYDFGDFRDYRP